MFELSVSDCVDLNAQRITPAGRRRLSAAGGEAISDAAKCGASSADSVRRGKRRPRLPNRDRLPMFGGTPRNRHEPEPHTVPLPVRPDALGPRLALAIRRCGWLIGRPIGAGEMLNCQARDPQSDRHGRRSARRTRGQRRARQCRSCRRPAHSRAAHGSSPSAAWM